ncbi:MAG TPA: cupin domain-containing protein [Blastocatellia bacterium]|nr:cupin domain-containing protein [Blastocatellia bacterium]
MKHAALTDDAVERTALYALGALTQIEARAFEDHLAEGCEICRNELDQYQLAVEALGAAAPEAEPSPQVRERLLASIGGAPTAAAAADEAPAISAKAFASAGTFVSRHADEDGWQRWDEGIFYKPLFIDETTGQMTSLVRMRPGTALPPHEHLGVEQFLIIEGDCNVCGERLGPGDYHRALGGSIHETTYTETGTTFLLVAPAEYRILEAR